MQFPSRRIVTAAVFALVSAAPSCATAQSVAWTTFQDPFEKAFTLEVPSGWTARGGLLRMGFSDERGMVEVTSPDGRVTVRMGDVAVPAYTPPDQMHREGTVIDLGAQAQLGVARYRTGPEFAALYSRVRFYQICPNPAADTKDLGFTMPEYVPNEGAQPEKSSAGEIASECTTDKGARVAYVFARTSMTGTIWTATTLGSFLAAPEQVTLARQVLEHGARTFRLSPEWIEYQKQMDAYALDYQRARQQQRRQALAAQVQQFEAKMQAMRSQVSAFERRQQAQASQVEGFTQALRGVTPTLDPLTGESREVWTGSKQNYWANGQGGVANATNSPGAGWYQLTVTTP
jgi:hypothetical protein